MTDRSPSSTLSDGVRRAWASLRLGLVFGGIGLCTATPVVAVPDAAAPDAAASGAPIFQCNTRKHQIVIDGDPAAERFRYRAWNRPKPMSAPPDMAVASGTQDYEGTGPCRYHFYRFKTGNVEYRVADSLGCNESWPPKDAVGELTVLIGGEVKSSQWCRR